LLDAGAEPNAMDFSDSTPLLALAYASAGERQLICADVLLKAGADASLENEFGWSSLHVAHNQKNNALMKLLVSHVHQSYLDTFDAEKPRNLENRKYIERNGAHNRIPLELRESILCGGHSIEHIAKWLNNRLASETTDPPRVVVLCGAGISTNAGIPDFRSPGTGLYNDPKLRSAFDAQGFRKDPSSLWEFARRLHCGLDDGSIRPTASHFFLRLLQSKGLLLRIFTQNIDGLEIAAGVPAASVVESHGTMNRAKCTRCGYSANMDDVKRDLATTDCATVLPTCPFCGAVLRPAVTMFGEELPKTFDRRRAADIGLADLLIVMGTSLVVYPFAGLVNQVGPLVPRLLINNKLTGPFQHLPSASSAGATRSYRDAAAVGDCDAGVRSLCEALGWADDLDKLIANYER